MNRENFCREIIDSLSAHIAVLDQDGVIILTNKAWQDFGGANGLQGPADSLGQNYITIAEAAGDETGRIVAQGIRKVISGDLKEFFINYPCHSPLEKRWYAMRVVRLQFISLEAQVIVSHEDITPIMQAQEDLKRKEEELFQQKKMLEESNVALKVLLEHREKDRRSLEENVLANVRKLVMPYLEELSFRKLDERSLNLLNIVHQRLEEIVAPFLNRLTSLNRLLSPREIDVAALVREGRTSKEIAEVLSVSVSAVDFHRKKIRKKLGLTNDRANLRSYLLSLQ
ncbi:MAG: PAS domain-containing protein [Deltaproteobacteria bacterium]|jgi:DNA-binding CsgD family transcriptional regulator|nr:PAS domain-containing protein [Deltaproteobacteria bacterium]